MKNKKSLRAKAFDLLARREMSRVELTKKLAKYTEDKQEIADLLDEFASKNWQSDARFAQDFIEMRSSKYSYRRTVEELKQKGISLDQCAKYQPDREAEIQAAFSILKRKFKIAPTSLVEKQKQMRFLAYRGFDFDIISTVLKLWHQPQE